MADLHVQLRYEREPLKAGDVVDRLAEDFQDESQLFRRRALWWMNRVMEDILSRFEWPWATDVSSITTRKGLAEYPVGEEVAFIEGPMEIAGKQAITRRDPSVLIRKGATDNSIGVPKMFAQTAANTVLFWPTPDGAYNVVYRYQKRFLPLEDEDSEILFPQEMLQAIVMGVTYRLRMADDRNDPATVEAFRMYETMLRNLIWKYTVGEVDVIEGGYGP